MNSLFIKKILNNHRNNTKIKKENFIIWLIGAVILSFLFILSSTYYLNYVKETIRQDSKSNLAELGKHITESLNNEICTTNEILGSLAIEIIRNEFPFDQELTNFLFEQSQYWNFDDLSVIDINGINHHADGSVDMPANRQLLSYALETGTTMYDFQIVDDEDCVIFYMPLPLQDKKESRYMAISGTYAVHNWSMLMNIDIFDGHAITQILTKDGVVITKNLNSNTKKYYNFLKYLKDAEFENNTSIETIHQSMQQGKSIHISYKLDKIEYYFNCEPIGFNDWYFVFTVPAYIVNNAGDNMAHSVLIISACLTLIFMLFLFSFRVYQIRANRKLWNTAYKDYVTGGANKNKFEIDAETLLEKRDRNYILVYANIQQFKLINQRFGKLEADYILHKIYKAIEKLTNSHECCGRLFADNFVMLLEEDKSGEVQKRLADFSTEQSHQNTSTGIACPIRFSFGLCNIENEDIELTQIIDRANLAMKSIRPSGEMNFAIYDSSMLERAARERELTEHLLKKDIKKEFFICLQPKVDLITGQVVGAEALARWNSPDFGVISPGEFIPIAEKAGIICDIDWNAFEYVCQTISKWIEKGCQLIPISFNLSKAQLALPNFLDFYRNTIAKYNIPCQYLDFEFTESLLYENSGALQKAVDEIHKMGCLCSVDDFGFGYSSLGLLGQFEADTLKLDRTFFLDNAKFDSRNNQIVRSVIQMANSLGMSTVAEGIEDFEHVEMLREFGCNSVQGYIFAKPMPVNQFEDFVKEQKKKR